MECSYGKGKEGRGGELSAGSAFGAHVLEQPTYLTEARLVDKQNDVEHYLQTDTDFSMVPTVEPLSHHERNCWSVQKLYCSSVKVKGAN